MWLLLFISSLSQRVFSLSCKLLACLFIVVSPCHFEVSCQGTVSPLIIPFAGERDVADIAMLH